jgi:hypothetical protein
MCTISLNMVQKLEFQIEVVCVFCEIGTASCKVCISKVTKGKLLIEMRHNISSVSVISNVQILSFLNNHFVKIRSSRTIQHEEQISVRENDQLDAHFLSLIHSSQTILYMFRTNNCWSSGGYFCTRSPVLAARHPIDARYSTVCCV